MELVAGNGREKKERGPAKDRQVGLASGLVEKNGREMNSCDTLTKLRARGRWQAQNQKSRFGILPGLPLGNTLTQATNIFTRHPHQSALVFSNPDSPCQVSLPHINPRNNARILTNKSHFKIVQTVMRDPYLLSPLVRGVSRMVAHFMGNVTGMT